MPVKIGTAPKYFEHRDPIISSTDDPATAPQSHGINFQERRYGLIQVVPAGGANPVIDLFFWSEGADRFVSGSPLVTFAALGADVPGEIMFEALGRIVLPVVTIAGGTVRLYVSSFGLSGSL